MKTTFKAFLILVIPVLGSSLSAAPLANYGHKLSVSLQQIEPNRVGVDSLIEVVIFLEDKSVKPLEAAFRGGTAPTRTDRIKSTIRRLRSHRPEGERELLSWLSEYSPAPVERFWITPAYRAIIPAARLSELAAQSSIRMIIDNVKLSFDEPVDEQTAPSLTPGLSAQLQMLGVSTLWGDGLTGKGRLIASFDTGVEGTHPAVSSKWRGNSSVASAAWYAPATSTETPHDATGHGTHTMGIMVGSTPTDTFGVAFEADWISAGVIDQGGSLSATVADIISAFQWVLNPDGDPETTDDVPDVILNSWGIPKGLFPDCDETFWAVIDAVEEAGIVTIFAAGNEGPDATTMRNPADRSST
ncbi:MAG: S8 family serine peptidase, partial [candidate division Zixibacteria bacterium]